MQTQSRTEKTICLAVSPSLKAVGISGRNELFEVIQKIEEENVIEEAKHQVILLRDLLIMIQIKESPELSLDYITAPPRMAEYLKYSTRIYNIYLKYVAPEDIHVYSIDEVFMDVTHYLRPANLSAREFAMKNNSGSFSKQLELQQQLE